MALPTRGIAYDFYMALIEAGGSTFRVNPTIAAGDFQISKDGGALANLATLPVVMPAGSISVKVSLSALEMTASKILIIATDQAGSEWSNATVFLDVPASSVDNVGDHVVGNRTIDFDGDDALGWQEVVYDEATGLVEVARYDLADETDTRINETAAVFVVRGGMIKTRTRSS